jgi:hypothetical protein
MRFDLAVMKCLIYPGLVSAKGTAPLKDQDDLAGNVRYAVRAVFCVALAFDVRLVTHDKSPGHVLRCR